MLDMKKWKSTSKLWDFMKKINRKTILISSLAIFLILGLIARGQYKNHQSDLQVKADMMYHVEKWDINVQVKVNAKASLVDEQNLSFWQEWKIVSVKVDIWDEVTAWDVFADIDLDDYYNAIQTSKL